MADQQEPFVQRLRAIVADPENHWVLSGREKQPQPGRVHPLADAVLVDALRAAGWTAVAKEYERVEEACNGFWYD